MSFDPSNFNPGEHSGGSDQMLPPGTYIMWVRSFKRGFNNGKENILFILDPVATEEHKKIPKDTYAPVFEHVTLTEAAAFRLANLANAVGRMTPFNAMSDRDVGEIFKFQPIKVKVTRQTYQEQESAKVAGYVKLTEEDEALANELLEQRNLDEATGGGGSNYNEFDPGASYNSGAQTQQAQQPQEPGGQTWSDDDIPF